MLHLLHNCEKGFREGEVGVFLRELIRHLEVILLATMTYKLKP